MGIAADERVWHLHRRSRMQKPHDPTGVSDSIGVGDCTAAVFREINRNEHPANRSTVLGNRFGTDYWDAEHAHRGITQKRSRDRGMPKPTDATALMGGGDEKIGLFLARRFDQTDVGPAQAGVRPYA